MKRENFTSLNNAGYLQAFMCYAHLQEFVIQNHGDPWFTNPKAGEFLKEIWAVGQKYKAWELVQQLRYGDLDIVPLIYYMEELLGND